MYFAIYKCRLCGKEFWNEKDREANVVDFTITNILAHSKHSNQESFLGEEHKIDVHKFHKCKDGSFGFADFQGFKKVSED